MEVSEVKAGRTALTDKKVSLRVGPALCSPNCMRCSLHTKKYIFNQTIREGNAEQSKHKNMLGYDWWRAYWRTNE
jgi:hypothetical protein